MIFEVLTLFPEIFTSFLSQSLLAKAIAKGILTVNTINIRDFTHDRHQTADDRPYGGGPGMVLKPEPLAEALDDILRISPRPLIINLTPSGQLLNQNLVKTLSEHKRLALICGRYEGVDQRIIDLYVDKEISIGDYVVNGGEVPAMILIEALARTIEGFLGSGDSIIEESHNHGLLEHPVYTRPRVFRKLAVPSILFSGNHQQIAAFRLAEAMAKTRDVRPELLSDPDVVERAVSVIGRAGAPLSDKTK
ncbi:MAG: tRNA (guanosine(37)-N1)-methyltransferase TrmD [Deltaproteobacteria bacterium]|jgi:tRNA (guanine37-N1)-methyltransferase|nr:tRNA (guanosine(37)-N1)-methyltransferase TrmD [Deltaproteobacteria bacterium]